MKKYLNYTFFTILCFALFSCNTKQSLNNNFCDCAKTLVNYNIGNINLVIPNFISPNGDMINDKFHIDAYENFPDSFSYVNNLKLKVKIYKGLIKKYESSDYQNDWPDKNINDGKYKYNVTYGDQTIEGYFCVYAGKKRFKEYEFDCRWDLNGGHGADPVFYL
jgi:hypothetical protein